MTELERRLDTPFSFDVSDNCISQDLGVQASHVSGKPGKIRKPLTKSEPSLSRNPELRSEPVGRRKPSEESEPSVTSNPEVKSEPKNERKTPSKSASSSVRALVEIYYDVQDVRIRSFNRLRQVGEVKGVNPNILKELENQIKLYIQHDTREKLIWQTFLRGIKGIGPILSGGLISWLDPRKAKHASSFWKYCGLAPNQKRQKGQKGDYNPTAKVLCWKIADSFIKQRTPFYRDLYDIAKREETIKLNNPLENPKNCPHYNGCIERLSKTANRLKRQTKKLPCKKHIDYRARRKMVKRFLLDLWLNWRRLEGLSTSEPYVIAMLGHQKVEVTA